MRLITLFLFFLVTVGFYQPLSAESVYFECIDREGESSSRTIRIDFKEVDSLNMIFMPTSEGAIDRRSKKAIKEGVRRSGLLLEKKAAFFEAPEIESEEGFWGSVSGDRVLKWIEDTDKPLLFEFLAVNRDVDVTRVTKIMAYFFSLDLMEAEIDDFVIIEHDVSDSTGGGISLELENSPGDSEQTFSGHFQRAIFSCEGRLKMAGFKCIKDVVQSWPEESKPSIAVVDDSGWVFY